MVPKGRGSVGVEVASTRPMTDKGTPTPERLRAANSRVTSPVDTHSSVTSINSRILCR